MNINFRKAVLKDLLSVDVLIKKSARALQVKYYKRSEIEAALELIGGMELLVASGNYFVAEKRGLIIGCGGFCCDSVGTKAAEIRAFFVDPDFSRKGIAVKILSLCETHCLSMGIEHLFLRSTLSGEPFYKKHGFVEVRRFRQGLSNEQSFELVEMIKHIGP